MSNKQTERSRKMEKKVIIISDSEESEEYVLHANKKQEKIHTYFKTKQITLYVSKISQNQNILKYE